MQDLATAAPAFVQMAHTIVWASVATVDPQGRPRSRVLHPYWEWDGTRLAGWVATWAFDDETCTRVWELFKNGPEPVGCDPAIIPGWDSPASPDFAVLCLEPWRLRVFPGTVLMGRGGDVLTWTQ